MISVDDSYDDYPQIEEAFQEMLDESLQPRGPHSLFDLVAGMGLAEGSQVIDLGCGEGEQSLELAERFGFEVLGVDPVVRHIELARSSASDSDASVSLRFDLGTAEAIPVADASIDLVWCRESLMYTPSLEAAAAEIERVLRPAGKALIYQVCTGPEMSWAEADVFWPAGAALAASSDPGLIGAAIQKTGLVIDERIDFTSEWGERAQESNGASGRRLLHAARLRRDPQRYIDRFGETNYQIMLTDCLWHVYRMFGKLTGVAFLVTKR